MELAKTIRRYRVIIFVLTILLAVFIVPFSGTIYKKLLGTIEQPYQPWDPENTMNIREDIANINKEAIQLEEEQRIWTNYRLVLKTSLIDMAAVIPDTGRITRVQTFLALQPNTALQYTLNNFPTEGTVFARDDRRFDKVYEVGGRYSQYYLDMVMRGGYMINSASLNLSNIVLTGRDFNSYVSVPNVNASSFNADKNKLIDIVKNFDTVVVRGRLAEIQTRLPELQTKLSEKKRLYQANNIDINRYAVIIGIPLFIIVAFLMYYFGISQGRKLTEYAVNQNIQFSSDDYRTGLSFTLFSITVLLLILSLLILGLAKALGDNALSALLGTIAGYVLNSQNQDKTRGSTHPPAAPPAPPPPAPPAAP
jgi:hypothetical protein